MFNMNIDFLSFCLSQFCNQLTLSYIFLSSRKSNEDKTLFLIWCMLTLVSALNIYFSLKFLSLREYITSMTFTVIQVFILSLCIYFWHLFCLVLLLFYFLCSLVLFIFVWFYCSGEMLFCFLPKAYTKAAIPLPLRFYEFKYF